MNTPLAHLFTATLTSLVLPLPASSTETVEISAYTYDVAGGTAFVSSFILPRHVPYCSTLLPGFAAAFELGYAAWTEEFKETIAHGRLVLERDGNGRTVEAQIRNLEPALEAVETELKGLPVHRATDRCRLVLKTLTAPNPLRGKVIRIK